MPDLSDSREMGVEATPSRPERSRHLLELSNAVVRIYKQFHGKGPTKARSYLTGDLLTVILEGGFTRSEQTLHERGHDEAIAQSRFAMQHAVEGELRTAVEGILGRGVRSFMSANDPEQGLQAEVFVLMPQGSEAPEEDLPSRAQRVREEHREVLEEHKALRAEQVQSRRNVQRRTREPGS